MMSALLLTRLAHPCALQANSADILCAIAHSQPSPLASKLMQPAVVRSLLGHATGGAAGALVVPALDVCVALLEPRRSSMEPPDASTTTPANIKARADAAATMLQVRTCDRHGCARNSGGCPPLPC